MNETLTPKGENIDKNEAEKIIKENEKRKEEIIAEFRELYFHRGDEDTTKETERLEKEIKTLEESTKQAEKIIKKAIEDEINSAEKKIEKKTPDLIGMGKKTNEALVTKGHFSNTPLKEALVNVNDKKEKPTEKEPTKEKGADNEESNTQKVIEEIKNEEKIKKQEKINELKKEEDKLKEEMTKRNLKIENLLKLAESLPDEFSTDFIEEKTKNFLESLIKEGEIKEIKKDPKIEGVDNKIILTTKIFNSGFFHSEDINIKIILESKEDSIFVKDHEIKASNHQEAVEKELIPKLNQIPILLKSYIEKELNKKVKKIWIENGKIKAI